MKQPLLQSKIKPVIQYLPKRELAKIFPLSDFQSVSKVLCDPKKKAFLKREMKLNPNGCVAQAVKQGSKAHSALEKGEAKSEMDKAVLEAFDKAFSSDFDEVWGMEEWLAHPLGYKGRFDGVGVFRGKVTLFDHKKTNVRKTASKLKGYFPQLAAYRLAHEFLYSDHKIEQVAILNIWGKDPESVGAEATVLSGDDLAPYEEHLLLQLIN